MIFSHSPIFITFCFRLHTNYILLQKRHLSSPCNIRHYRSSILSISTTMEKTSVVAGFLLFFCMALVSRFFELLKILYFSLFLSFFVVFYYFLFSTAWLLLDFCMYFSSLFFQICLS